MNDVVDKMTDFFKMNFLINMRTGNLFIDMIVSTIIMLGIPFIISQYNRISDTIYTTCKYWVSTGYSSIIIEGKRSFRNNSWSTRTNNIWSKRFDAIWDHINNHSDCNGINHMKELTAFNDSYNDDNDNNKNKNKIDNDIYVVGNDCPSFPLNNEKTIYAKITLYDNSTDSDKLIELCGKIDTIKIEIYSKILTIKQLKEYIDNLTYKYIDNIEKHRDGKIFIYSLQPTIKDEEGESNVWMERPFRSTRKFDNLYFDGKNDLIDKIDFFVNNKEWYESEGHPYTMGIGLSGSPGTGKTSVIKCLANKLGRHLIQIPLNKVKNETDFYKYFFESTYNRNNSIGSIDFEKKIIVLEDIDCMSDIILDRSRKTVTDTHDTHDNSYNDVEMFENIMNVVSIASNDNKKSGVKYPFQKEEKLTLSFILNLIDGLDENYGRILIITSNFYDKIDPALIRPGRIDLKIEMKKASVQTINNMYLHYYKHEIPSKELLKLKDNVISPAELVNYYRTTKTSKEFINIIVNKCNQ